MGKKPNSTAEPRVDETPPPPQTPAVRLSRRARIAWSAFIAFHLLAMVVWAMPLDSPLTVQFRESIKGYILFTGLFQKWDMFAPDPSKLNNYLTATVTYRNGRTSVWEFPRMENLGIVDKYFKERYRKYASDNLRLDTRSQLWPDAARYVARANAAGQPVEVALVRHWSEVQPPGPHGDPLPSPWNEYTFFRYTVQPEDLR